MKEKQTTKSKHVRRMEFSKKVFIVVSIIGIYVVLFSSYMVWKTGDLSPLNYLIPATAAEVATGTGFYYNKAKAENEIKLRGRGNPTDEKGDDP